MLKIFSLVFIVSFEALAYIPSADFILGRVAQRGGKGSYKIIQELLFQSDNQSSIAKETWFVKDSHNYFVEVRGKSFTKYFLYKNGRRYFVDDNKQVQSSSLPTDFFEPLFLARDSGALKKDLISKKILPGKSARVQPKPRTLKDVKHTSENYVHLSRNRGVVNYVFAETDDLAPTGTEPAIWIEQDKFSIRRLRLASLADITADDIAEFSHGLSFPKSRRVTWGKNSVQIELLRIDSVTLKDEVFNTSYISNLAQKLVPVEESKTKPVIEDFYSRFR